MAATTEEEDLLDLLEDSFESDVRNGSRPGDFRRWRPPELSIISPSCSPHGGSGIRQKRKSLGAKPSTSSGNELAETSCRRETKWPDLPLQREVNDGNTRCRISKAKPPVCPRSPRVLRTLSLGPVTTTKLEDELVSSRSKPSLSRPQRIVVSASEFERCYKDLGDLPKARRRRSTGSTGEPEKTVGEKETFKSAFEKRCRSKTETTMVDTWKNYPDPCNMRAPSELDLILNQVYPPPSPFNDLDLETIDKTDSRSRAPNKNHWSWRGGADVYVRPCSSTASTRPTSAASTQPNSVASTRQSSIDSRSGAASRSSSNGLRQLNRSFEESLRRSGFVVEPVGPATEQRISKAARRRSL